MKNLQSKINKLMTALRKHGIVYRINTEQFYSEEQDRLITKSILYEYHPKKDGIVFYSKVELLKHLAEQWRMVTMYEENGEERENTD